jgi:hypothetical protein
MVFSVVPRCQGSPERHLGLAHARARPNMPWLLMIFQQACFQKDLFQGCHGILGDSKMLRGPSIPSILILMASMAF